MNLDSELKINNIRQLLEIIEKVAKLTNDHKYEIIYQIGVNENSLDSYIEGIYFNCVTKQLFQLIFDKNYNNQGLWLPIELEKRHLDIIYRKDREYQLLSWQSKLYIIDCFCGAVDIFDVNYILNRDEVAEYFKIGIDFLDKKSQSVKCTNRNLKTG